MVLAEAIDQLHGFLAERSRPAGMTVSQFVAHEAAAGSPVAKQLLAVLFNGACDDDTAAAPAPIVPPAVLDRQHRLATQTLPDPRTVNRAEPARPILASGATRPWMRQ